MNRETFKRTEPSLRTTYRYQAKRAITWWMVGLGGLTLASLATSAYSLHENSAIVSPEGAPTATISNSSVVFKRGDYLLERTGAKEVTEWANSLERNGLFTTKVMQLDSGFKNGRRELVDAGCTIKTQEVFPDRNDVTVFTVTDASCIKNLK